MKVNVVYKIAGLIYVYVGRRLLTLNLGGDLMTSNQIKYAEVKENQRHNVVTERETGRHNVATEDLGFSSLRETGRHNLVAEQQGFAGIAESVRHNQAQEATNWYQAQNLGNLQASQAELNRSNIGVQAQNVAVNAYNADINARNAETNAKNAQINQQNADTNWSNYLVNSQNAFTNQQNALTNAGNLDVNQGNLNETVKNNRFYRDITNDRLALDSATQTANAVANVVGSLRGTSYLPQTSRSRREN